MTSVDLESKFFLIDMLHVDLVSAGTNRLNFPTIWVLPERFKWVLFPGAVPRRRHCSSRMSPGAGLRRLKRSPPPNDIGSLPDSSTGGQHSAAALSGGRPPLYDPCPPLLTSERYAPITPGFYCGRESRSSYLNALNSWLLSFGSAGFKIANPRCGLFASAGLSDQAGSTIDRQVAAKRSRGCCCD